MQEKNKGVDILRQLFPLSQTDKTLIGIYCKHFPWSSFRGIASNDMPSFQEWSRAERTAFMNI